MLQISTHDELYSIILFKLNQLRGSLLFSLKVNGVSNTNKTRFLVFFNSYDNRFQLHYVSSELSILVSFRPIETSSSNARPKRQTKKPEFGTDTEVQVERSILYQYRYTLFCFFYQKACVSTTLNSKAWPRGYSEEDKIALKPRHSEFIRHNLGVHRMLYLGHGPVDEVRLQQKLTAERVKRGLPPTFLRCTSPALNS